MSDDVTGVAVAQQEDDDHNDPSSCSSSVLVTVILLICGLPGSGKSTLARWLVANKVEQQQQQNAITQLSGGCSNGDDSESVGYCCCCFDRVVHIEYDAIARDVLHDKHQQHDSSCSSNHQTQTFQEESNNNDNGVQAETDVAAAVVFDDQSLQAWRTSRTAALQQLQHELQQQQETKTNHRLLIVMDDNFHLRSMRRDVYRTCQQFVTSTDDTTTIPLFFGIIWVDTCLKVCRQRNQQRSERLPDAVLDKLFQTMELPDAQKKNASWEQCCLHLKCDETIMTTSTDDDKKKKNEMLQQIYDFVKSLQNYPIQPPQVMDPQILLLQQERQATLESRMHSYDRLLRTWVGKVAQINKRHVKTANDTRRDILQRLKTTSSSTLEHHDDEDDEPQQVMEWFLEAMMMNTNQTPSWSEEDQSRLSNVLQDSLQAFMEQQQQHLQTQT